MKRVFLTVAAAFVFSSPFLYAQSERISSDFEIAAAKRQLSGATTPFARIAAHLNLGDAYASRSESQKSRDEYSLARSEAERERVRSRRDSDLSSYARATSYSGLAAAKRGDTATAFELFEESIRYIADSAGTWNLYASGMLIAGGESEAIGAARTAVAIAESNMERAPSTANALDLNVYRYTLASALARRPDTLAAAAELLRTSLRELESARFEKVRDEVASREAFEVMSTAAGDTSTYVSVVLRSRLKLAAIEEQRGNIDAARAAYGEVLRQRNDEPIALAALARLASSNDDREKYFIDAFDANPFAIRLIDSYEEFVKTHSRTAAAETTGGKVRQIVELLSVGDGRGALTRIDALEQRFPANETLLMLRAQAEILLGHREVARRLALQLSSRSLRDEITARIDDAAGSEAVIAKLSSPQPILLDDGDLRALAALLRREELDAATRRKIDDASLQAMVRPVDASSNGELTSIRTFTTGGLSLRTTSAVNFRGTFSNGESLRLTFHLLGVSRDETGEFLLIEPEGVAR
jgi:hypothetical protein